MSEKSSFFNSINEDRPYDAEDFAEYFAAYFTNGIFNNGLQVIANSGMAIALSVGIANNNGYRYKNESNKILNIANADGILNRIDNIVIRLDLPNRKVTAEIIQGEFSENAVAPDLVRDNSIYDLRIAKINIPAGTTEITQDLIEDTRFNSDDCGNVICAVETPDFTDILIQYETIWKDLIDEQTVKFSTWFTNSKGLYDTWFTNSKQNFNVWFLNSQSSYETWFSNFKAVSDASFSSWMTNSKGTFKEWFEALQDVLDENTEAHLLNLIQKLDKRSIIVSEDEPTQDCIWYKVLNTREHEDPDPEDEDAIYLETTDYDDTAIYIIDDSGSLEKVTNMSDEIVKDGDMTIEEI